jgi:ribosomal protein L23
MKDNEKLKVQLHQSKFSLISSTDAHKKALDKAMRKILRLEAKIATLRGKPKRPAQKRSKRPRQSSPIDGHSSEPSSSESGSDSDR